MGGSSCFITQLHESDESRCVLCSSPHILSMSHERGPMKDPFTHCERWTTAQHANRNNPRISRSKTCVGMLTAGILLIMIQ